MWGCRVRLSPFQSPRNPTCTLFICLFLLASVVAVNGLKVEVDYSFSLPKELGIGTFETEKCCPHVSYPDNATDSMFAPTVFGLGAQKGGTSAAYTLLKIHPQMLYPVRKELGYLDDEGGITYQEYLEKWRWNHGNLTEEELGKSSPAEGGLMYEFTPEYLYVPVVACRVKIISPSAKFIVFLREPVSRAHSAFSFLKHNYLKVNPNFGNWTTLNFWEASYKAMLDIDNRHGCDFHSGAGEFTMNDCNGCMARMAGAPGCKGMGHVMYKENKEHDCNFVGFIALTRGMYAAQLAWWFTFFPPERFHIVNSYEFSASPLNGIRAILDFLELHEPYTEEMFARMEERQNRGTYDPEDEEMLEATTAVLREYFRRPNLELYGLLEETGHSDFKPFESELAKLESIDCRDERVVSTGICGTDFIGSLDPDWRNVKVENPAADGSVVAVLEQLAKKKQLSVQPTEISNPSQVEAGNGDESHSLIPVSRSRPLTTATRPLDPFERMVFIVGVVTATCLAAVTLYRRP